MADLQYIEISKIHSHPDNPRKQLGDLTELADSIKANGIFQNLTVVPWSGSDNYTVVIGHRRLAAAKLAGLDTVPCIVTEMDYKEQVQTMLLENMQRSDLTVYEQAQGFQMMLDLGSTVDEIAEKTGFSKATVRRRVKMTELDQDVLKEVSERQISLADFDKLAQIEDINTRNKCLESIGTANFAQNVTYQLRKQNIKKNLPAIKKLLKAAKAKAIKQSETYGPKYDHIGSALKITDWKEETPIIPEKVSGKLYYYLDETWGTLTFYQSHKRASPVKRPAAEIEREKHIAEVWNNLTEKASVAYTLRSTFVINLNYSRKNAEAILRGALIAGVLKTIDYMGSDRDGIGNALGLDMSVYDQHRGVKAVEALKDLDEDTIPSIIYAMFGDSAEEPFSNSYKKQYPEYKPSPKLNGLYDWLTSLGYVMSDEEKALQDGTHELFKEAEKSRPQCANTESGGT